MAAKKASGGSEGYLLTEDEKEKEESSGGTDPVTRPTQNTTEARINRAELHHKLLRDVADLSIAGDFERLKSFCGVWIAPTILENITDTRELLNQLERQAVIAVGDYSKLIDMLGLLNLNAMKERVKGLARDISALGLQREAEGSLQFPLGKVAEKEGIGREREELHQQLLLKVADSVIERDFVRLKGLCKSWIEPAVLQNITSTQELLEQLQQQAIINVGEYSELTRMLHQLHLVELKDQVEKLSREIKAAGMRASKSSTEYEDGRLQRHDLPEKANATIDGVSGGVIRYKEVQVTVPPNAISGHIQIEFVDQPSLARAVHDNTKGKANLHCQGICVTCTEEDATFSDPVEIRVTVRTLLEKANDQRINSEDFRILREKDGEITDVTVECNIRLDGEDIVFYCRKFSILDIALVSHLTSRISTGVFSIIKYIFQTSYRCKICPYIKGGHDQGLIVKLFCHGVDVKCSADLEHQCISENMRLRNKATLWFEVDCWCIESKKMKNISSTDCKLERDRCESTGTYFSKIETGVRALVADEVRLCVKELTYEETLMDRSVKVHVESATPPIPIIPEVPDSALKLHRELLREVAGSLIHSDFKRLKAECKDWIKPAQLEKITDTLELLDQFEKRQIIKFGEYSNLIHVLGVLDLNQLKGRVEGLSRAINALGVDLSATDASPNLT